METLTQLFDLVLHIGTVLPQLVAAYGPWIYLILFLIIFCETGLVVTPFLPGDSLLFMAGTLAATGAMDIHLVVMLLIGAAILGDSTNYLIGRTIGMRLFTNPDSKIFRRSYIERTHAFYERHGGKTVILARFAPIVRTFAPFVAGVGQMGYPRFLAFSVTGSVLWVGLFCYAGYKFGNLPIVRQNLELLVFAIIFLSFLPGIIAWLKARYTKRQAAT
ncbi:DedA family protein [Paludibacterium paludis]|uniref:Membrane protein n=1 Tax=Paludibacterium paludis TaxID=1225769 RepID=A0A918U9C2_9NEIS|nr:DedA family protein [Paludibacterium paludis]GGY11478.1 membrane protein [Paludibacterium paludis]